MWTAGPGRIGPLRWPARVLPMLAVGVLVLVCVLVSRHGRFDAPRRWIAAAVLIGLLFVRSFCAAPHLVVRHLVATAVVAALTVVLVRLARTRGPAAACAVAIVAMFPIAYTQVRGQAPTPMSYHFPERRSEMTAAFPRFDGVTLQLADRALVPPAEQSAAGAWGSLAFGNYAKNLGLNYVAGATSPCGRSRISLSASMFRPAPPTQTWWSSGVRRDGRSESPPRWRACWDWPRCSGPTGANPGRATTSGRCCPRTISTP
ncbi:hypothetical protein ACQP06_16405 [Nocardia sp. CA-136227]|uniref:hypothetical protein n=1 Tax=Nocardia sp. CA-136227 TaxID=3239979 RepID=UPI003D96A87F